MLDQNDKLLKMMAAVFDGSDIKLTDIPDIDLYMDQVTTFIDNKLSYLKRGEEDKLLTKTMINNYTKSKILLPPKNKKYQQEHMILLILIYYLKQIISINDINELFSPLFERLHNDKEKHSIFDLYNDFLEIKAVESDNLKESLAASFSVVKNKVADSVSSDKEFNEMFLTVLTLVAQAYMQKRLAEKIIDEYFSSNKKEK